MKKHLRVSYNAPVSLTFSIFCSFIFLADYFIFKHKLISLLFTVPGNKNFDWLYPFSYVRLFTHVLGHIDAAHLLGNLTFILLIGPLMEEKYGSAMIALMLTVTAFVTGMINACFIPSSLLGASGIAFMLILLASISTIEKNQLPLSFIFLIAVFVLKEFISPSASNVSTIAHIAGGLCGSLFGFLVAPKTARSQKTADSKTKTQQKKQPQQQSSENSYKNSAQKDSDETVIGTVQL